LGNSAGIAVYRAISKAAYTQISLAKEVTHMKRTLLSVALSLSCFAATSAFAADGYVTGNVNLRAGPDISYPSVDMLPAGTPVAIYGCVDGWSWCDVSTGNDRGWVAGSFLQEEYQGRRVYIADYGVRIGIPIVSFVFGTYWADHYHNRSWYGNRDRWSHIQPHYRPIVRQDEYHGSPHGSSHGYAPPPPHAPARSPNHGPQPHEHAVPVNHQGRPASTAPHNAAPSRPVQQRTVQQRTVQQRAGQSQAQHPQPKKEHAHDDKDHKDNGH